MNADKHKQAHTQEITHTLPLAILAQTHTQILSQNLEHRNTRTQITNTQECTHTAKNQPSKTRKKSKKNGVYIT